MHPRWVQPDRDTGFTADHVFALRQAKGARPSRQPTGRTLTISGGETGRRAAQDDRSERIAVPVHGADDAGVMRGVAERLTDFLDDASQAPVRDEEIGPHPLEQLGFRQRAAPVLDQGDEQLECFGWQVDRRRLAAHGPRVHVKHIAGELNCHIVPRRWRHKSGNAKKTVKTRQQGYEILAKMAQVLTELHHLDVPARRHPAAASDGRRHAWSGALMSMANRT
jgi:hypothetical protein